MTEGVSAPKSPSEWLIFAGGVFVLVTSAVFLTTKNLRNAIEMGVSSMVITLGLMVVLVFIWRRLSDAVGS